MGSLRTFVESRWFAISNFIVVIASGICLYVCPQTWRWALVLPFVFWAARWTTKRTLFQNPLLDGGLIVFVFTAMVGYWAAYDETAAWHKLCLIIAAVFLYLAIEDQPVENFNMLAGFWFVTGIGIASYFLSTADFSTQTEKFRWIHQLGIEWMRMRPVFLQSPSIHPNDTAGMVIITSVFGLPLLKELRRAGHYGYLLKIFVLAGFGIILCAVVLASSRGAFLGLAGAVAVWLVVQFLLRLRSPLKERMLNLLPAVVVIGIILLEAVVLFIPSGLLGQSFSVGENVFVSRAEVFRSGLMILRDFPFTGGGLASFAGLYSQYVLVIPFYSLPHAHNMFLDVMIEQGLMGAAGFMLIQLMVTWRLLYALKENHEAWLYQLAACVSLFVAIFHGMVDDYLYGHGWTLFVLVPAGMAALISRNGIVEKSPVTSETKKASRVSLAHPYPWMFGGVLFLAVVWNPLAAQWYANLGAVKMAKLDLTNYPANQWTYAEDVSAWQSAESDFRHALAFRSDNQTANHRLGLIKFMSGDFEASTDYLHTAYDNDPTNRGIIKNLGYSYLWLGETGKAQPFLSRIPEAIYELEVYVWWWNDHGRSDLADHALQLAARLNTQP